MSERENIPPGAADWKAPTDESAEAFPPKSIEEAIDVAAKKVEGQRGPEGGFPVEGFVKAIEEGLRPLTERAGKEREELKRTLRTRLDTALREIKIREQKVEQARKAEKRADDNHGEDWQKIIAGYQGEERNKQLDELNARESKLREERGRAESALWSTEAVAKSIGRVLRALDELKDAETQKREGPAATWREKEELEHAFFDLSVAESREISTREEEKVK